MILQHYNIVLEYCNITRVLPSISIDGRSFVCLVRSASSAEVLSSFFFRNRLCFSFLAVIVALSFRGIRQGKGIRQGRGIQQDRGIRQGRGVRQDDAFGCMAALYSVVFSAFGGRAASDSAVMAAFGGRAASNWSASDAFGSSLRVASDSAVFEVFGAWGDVGFGHFGCIQRQGGIRFRRFGRIGGQRGVRFDRFGHENPSKIGLGMSSAGPKSSQNRSRDALGTPRGAQVRSEGVLGASRDVPGASRERP